MANKQNSGLSFLKKGTCRLYYYYYCYYYCYAYYDGPRRQSVMSSAIVALTSWVWSLLVKWM